MLIFQKMVQNTPPPAPGILGCIRVKDTPPLGILGLKILPPGYIRVKDTPPPGNIRVKDRFSPGLLLSQGGWFELLPLNLHV